MTLNIKIEKNVAIPIPNAKNDWPFEAMNVGDSFYFEHPARLTTAVSDQHRRNEEKRFTTRAEGKGRRVWRIK